MRFLLGFTICSVLLSAAPQKPDSPPANVAQTQTSQPEDADVLRARLAVERLRVMVEAGALPRVQLQQAEDALGDAQDMAILKRTVYGQDLTEQDAAEMVAA